MRKAFLFGSENFYSFHVEGKLQGKKFPFLFGFLKPKGMTRVRYKINPKAIREQLLEVVKLHQQQVWLLLQHLELLHKKIDDQEKDIMSVVKVLEQNNDLEEFLKVEVKELEGELECPVCLEVASQVPIYKCSDDHLICRCQIFSWICG